MTNVVNANPFKPNKLKIVSIGVNVTDETNDNMHLDSSQAIIAAERVETKANGVSSRTYGLIVDKQGMGVNMKLEDRVADRYNYALQVDGNMHITSTLYASNIVLLTNQTIGGGAGGGGNGSNFWILATREQNNIYYPGNVTLGNNTSAQSNAYTLNIAQSADRNIEHTQVSIQNLMSSQIRMGIIGMSNVSPAIFNTPNGVPIEFHASRGQSYFADKYKYYFYDSGTLCNIVSDVPHYTDANDAPHMVIDARGNVGVHTDQAPLASFLLRKENSSVPGQMIEVPTSEYMNFAVNGNAYACNIVMWDYESSTPKSLDDLYVRRMGVTIHANQIIPGDFSIGRYKFIDGLDVDGQLVVDGSQHITNNLRVEEDTVLHHLYATDAILFDIASFCNDVYVQRDMIVKESLRVKGNILTEALDSQGLQVWCNVQFTVAQDGFSNINYFGAGFSTPGRVGIGIRGNDEINHQLVVKKRDIDIYELELTNPDPRFIRSAFIGHAKAGGRFTSGLFQDGSLVFVTPASRNRDFNRDYLQAQQNFYFFPGFYETLSSTPLISESNLPVLNVHTNKRVGINMYDPTQALDVNGSVRFSGDLLYQDSLVGLWVERDYPIAGGRTFKGVSYYKPGVCSNIGVNMLPDPDYGMVVKGKVKCIDGYYTVSNELIIPWLDSKTSVNSTPRLVSDKMFTLSKVGIGIRQPEGTLELQDKFSPMTSLVMYSPESSGTTDPLSMIRFKGMANEWIVQHNDAPSKRTLEFGYGLSSFASNEARRAMWMVQRASGCQQVIIGGNMNVNTAVSTPYKEASLIVDGGVSVLGDVHVTGRYVINGQTLSNQNITLSNAIQNFLGTDDVYIGGRNVFVNPTRSLALGYTSTRNAIDDDGTVLFRVYQSSPIVPVIARFLCEGQIGFIEIANTSGRAVRIGFTGSSGFSILNNENKPYLTFNNDVPRDNKLGINTIEGESISANLHIHSEFTGSNMMRLSRYYIGDTTTNACPEIDLENRVVLSQQEQGGSYKRWTIRGPDTTFNQKLSMCFSDVDTPRRETFTFTSNGCIGIGSTQPEYAIDINTSGRYGAIRLYNNSPTGEATPQIILQSGSQIYGDDARNDYRLYSADNTFTLDVATNNIYSKLFSFDTSNHLGILGDAHPKYDVNVQGSINIRDTIYLNGNPLFGTDQTDDTDGFVLRATNVFLNPKMEYLGGVNINRSFGSSNIFHINASCNANLAVFDAVRFNESQIHFRGLELPTATTFNIYRLQQSNSYFQLRHLPNSGGNSYISGAADGYRNVIRWGPNVNNEYDVEIWGSARLYANAPYISLASTVIGHCNDHLCLLPPSHVGIGTTIPVAKLNVVASTDTSALRVEQRSTGVAITELVNSLGNEIFRVQDNGNVGIGTTDIYAKLHVHGDIRCTSPQSPSTPHFLVSSATCNVGIGVASPMYKLDVEGGARFKSLVYLQSPRSNCVLCLYSETNAPTATSTDYIGFGLSATELRYHVHASTVQHVFYAHSNALMRITGTGSVGIGSTTPSERLSLYGNMNLSGDLYPMNNTTQALGRLTSRWRDVYVANTIDLASTILSINNIGNLIVGGTTANSTRSVIGTSFIMNDGNPLRNNIEMKLGDTDPIMFVERTVEGVVANQYIPFLRSATTGGISVGTNTPRGVLHIVSDSSLPAIVADHTNANSCNVIEVCDNGTQFATFAKGGNVGIGSSTPRAKLDVFGSMRVTQSNIAQNVATFTTITPNKGFVIHASGNVGVGTMTPTNTFHVHGQQLFSGGISTFQENVFLEKDIDVRGNSYVHGDQTTDSDMRLKTDICAITNALDKIKTLTGCTFNKSSARGTGLIAQDVQKVLPEAVQTNPVTGYLSVAYGNMMGLIIEAIKELDTKLDDIRVRLQ